MLETRRPVVADTVLVLALLLAATPRAAPPSGEPTGGPRAGVVQALLSAEALMARGTADEAVAALVRYEEAARMAAAIGASDLQARARLGKGRALIATGHVDEGRQALEEGLEVARAGGHVDERLQVLQLLSDVSPLDDAVGYLRESAAVRQEAGDFDAEGLTYLRLAEVAAEHGRRDVARSALADALSVFRHTRSVPHQRDALGRRARLELAWGEARVAEESAREVLALPGPEPSDPVGTAARCLLGRSLRRQGRHAEAIPILREITTAEPGAVDDVVAADAREALAACYLDVGQPRAAAVEALAALALRRSSGQVLGEARAQLALALALDRLDRATPALGAIREALGLADAADGAPGKLRAVLHATEARLLVRLRDPLLAADAYDLALAALEGEGEAEDDGTLDGGEVTPAVSEEELLREQLAFLVRHELWARALESCASCAADPGPGRRPLDIEALRTVARQQDAALLVHRILDDSLLGWAVSPGGRLLGTELVGIGADQLSALVAGLRDGTEAGAWSRAHDVLIGPLEGALGDVAGIVVLQGAGLESVPFHRLRDADGVPLGDRFAVAELRPEWLPLPRPRGESRVVLDLVDPDGPSPACRALAGAAAGDGGGEPGTADESPRARERRRTREIEPGPPPTPPAPTEAEGFFFGARARSDDARARAAAADVLVLLGADRELPALAPAGSVVVVPFADASAGPALADRLVRAGARSVIVVGLPRSHPDLLPTLVALWRALEPGRAPADTVRELDAPIAGRRSLRVFGALR